MIELLSDESGQASAEYMLMLAIALALAASVIKKLIQPTFTKLSAALSSQLENSLFNQANMHTLRIGR